MKVTLCCLTILSIVASCTTARSPKKGQNVTVQVQVSNPLISTATSGVPRISNRARSTTASTLSKSLTAKIINNSELHIATSKRQRNFQNVATTTMFSMTGEEPIKYSFPLLALLTTATPSTKPTKKKQHKDSTKSTNKPLAKPHDDSLTCPKESEAQFNLFAKKCRTHIDCIAWNKGELCCELFGAKACTKGVAKPIKEQIHSPILGIIPRNCPERTLAELWWELKVCQSDDDCWPRICCPDGKMKYCRTSKPKLETIPVPIGRSISYFSDYIECTAPPPPIFDLHPKSCNSTLDCFPNVCCQELGKKHCRPPKKSILTLMTNFLNVGLVKRLTNNLVIK